MPRDFTKRLTEKPKWATVNHCGEPGRGTDMSQKWSLGGLFALILALLAGFTAPAAAEFFGCNDREGQVLSSRTIVTYPDGRHYARHRTTAEFAARPARVHHRTSRVRYHHRKRYYSNAR